MTIYRYKKGTDGMTAYRKLKGKEFKAKQGYPGECVFYLKPRMKGKFKGEYRWGIGVWCGTREESGEQLIGTSEGVLNKM